jgi:hypothetical protein
MKLPKQEYDTTVLGSVVVFMAGVFVGALGASMLF